MYRPVVLLVALMLAPSYAAAQQPCTTDANQVINELYRHMLERTPDAGAGHWVQQLQNGRMTVKDVVREIGRSQEHTQRFWRTEAGEEAPYFRAVGTLYRHVLGRQPDAAGARTWADVGAREGAAVVVDRLVNSAEYSNQFGDWGVPGSGGLRYCGPNNQGASTTIQMPSSQQAAADANMRFRAMDRNNDGIISRNEWRGSRRSFEIHDWNNDGVLSGDEVRAGAARAGRTFEDEEFDRDEEFEFLDVNNNNRIELREWHSSAGAFDRLDVNNDNVLTRAEFGRASGTFGALGTSGNLIVVDPRQEWTDTGITVSRGDTVIFETEGTVQLSTDPNDTADARGHRTGRRAADAPLRNAPAGSLLARIGNQGIIMVGNRRSLRANANGRLYLRRQRRPPGGQLRRVSGHGRRARTITTRTSGARVRRCDGAQVRGRTLEPRTAPGRPAYSRTFALSHSRTFAPVLAHPRTFAPAHPIIPIRSGCASPVGS